MATLQNVVSLYDNLKQEWTKTPSNLKKCGELLTQLKVKIKLYIILLRKFVFIMNYGVTKTNLTNVVWIPFKCNELSCSS